MYTKASTIFEVDGKYEIPTAARRARRKMHQQHVFSERAFKGITSVPIGRSTDVELKYDVPMTIRRELKKEELWIPGKENTKWLKCKKWGLRLVIFLAMWTALASLH